jgi:ABC-type multidrug transport system fused ATPase/permease subunit
MLSVIRVEELTNIDVGQNQYASGMGCGTKQASSREALYPLLPIGSSFNASLASSGSSALVHNGWPWRGNVLFKNVSMRYNPASPLVLDNVSLTIPAGTTLGVVGRTGSGKLNHVK